MKDFKLIIVVLLAFFYSACDIIEEPFMNKPETIDTTDIIEYKRKVLLEDYTGHRCGNCPSAHVKFKELMGIYGEQIIPLAVHVGFFAMPLGSYTADYRTDAGEELSSFFGISSLPTGMVNRSSIMGDQVLVYTSWGSAVDQILQQEPEIDINISNSYDSTSRALTINISALALTDVSKTLKLAVYLSEDSIISIQLDYNSNPEDITDYVHQHVLRDVINSTWGDLIASGSFVTDDIANRMYSYTLSSDWNANHCDVIAFIYDDETLEIIQAEMEHVVGE